MNTVNAHVNARAGQLSRTGSTRATTAGSRVEVRGELEIMNVSSAQEVIHLLEDTTSPFALQLQNVELRVGPSQSVRLGEAVPALREHLRRDLERQLQQVGRPGREGRAGVLAGDRDSASRSRTSVSSSSRTSNILLTGTVMGTADPRLFGGRVGAAATGKTAAVPQAQVSAHRRAADAEPVAARTVQPVSAAAASDAAAAQRTGVHAAALPAVVSSPPSAALAEQAQQERASAETTSLVQQILEVQGQVKSLLAEEGLSSLSAETAALKKKKGAVDGPEDEDRRARGIEGSTRGGSDMGGVTHSGREGQFGVGGSSSSALSTSSSGSSSSRTFPKATIMPKDAHFPQQNITGTAMVSATVASREAAADASRSSERPEEMKLTAEGPPRVDEEERETVSKRRKSTEDTGGGRSKESTQAEQAEGKETRGEPGKKGRDELEEQRRGGSPGTYSAEAKKETSAETTSRIDANEGQGGVSLDRPSATEPEHTGRDAKGDGESARGEKPQTGEEVQEGQDVRERTQRTEARGAKGEVMRANEAPVERVHPAKERGGRVNRGSLVETEGDSGKPTEPDGNLSGTTAQKVVQPTRTGSGQTMAQRQERAPREEQLPKLSDDSRPHLTSEEKSEGHPSNEVDRGTKDRVEHPPGQKTAGEEEEGSSRAGRGEASSTEGKEQEHGEGVRSEKPAKRESATGAEDASAAPVAAAPTFVQTLSNLFSWGGADDESKPLRVPRNEMEAKKTVIPEDAEADREVPERLREPPVQGRATAPVRNEDTGTSAAQEQSSKKLRPKLQPKAPPARLAVSKRDKE